MTVYQSIDALRSGELTLPEFLWQAEARYREREPAVLAFVPEHDRFARLGAEADALVAAFPDRVSRPALFGMLAGVKDIFHVRGFDTRAGSHLPAEALQGEEAACVSRLRDAGALIMGKTVTTEFAYFSPGPTRNPYNPEHTPGGSSSGSAAAVAADLCSLSLGTQTIGSIIRPAAFCGVVGVKPTYDRIPKGGVIPLSPTLDHVGLFAPRVEDAIRAARVLYTGWDEPTVSLKVPVLGIPEGPYLENLAEDGRAHFDRVCRHLAAGYQIESIPVMSDFQTIRDRHDVILSAEAARVHRGWFEKYRDLYSARFAELIHRGQATPAARLQAALAGRDDFRAEMRRAMIDRNIDLWIAPSAPGPAPSGLESTGDPVMNLPWTQAGLPAINLPAGKNQDGLPMGLQVVGNWYKDESLLFWAKDLEQALSPL